MWTGRKIDKNIERQRIDKGTNRGTDRGTDKGTDRKTGLATSTIC